ncbi:MAG: ABC transporter ATP-binding protein [Alphaproteobacteria bacterium]|nr:ABC transporter ATP-binding protein [Alphaproteobacteria bacterium]
MNAKTTQKTEKPILSLKGVGVNYGKSFSFRRKRLDRWVLQDISFDLMPGESLGVLGRNGIGKSTLLKTMAGVIAPDAGEVKLKKGCSASLLALGTGFMPELTGRENVFLGGMLIGMKAGEIRKRFDEIVAFAELEEAIDMPYYTYSSGMKSRLGFALSIQRNPDILLLDEVLGVGDVAFRKKSADALKERILGEQTVVLVSHNGQTIRELCNRAIWIEQGVIRMAGDPDQVVTEYEAQMLALEQSK